MKEEITATQRILAAAAHAGFCLGGLGFLVLPFLIQAIWSDSGFVVAHARQALYMQLGALAASLLVVPLAFFLSPEAAAALGVGFLAGVWGLFALVAVCKAIKGEQYVYPLLQLVHWG